MKILVVGGSGTIGSAVVGLLRERHEVIAAGFRSGDKQVDIADTQSIRALFESTGQYDAIICASGSVRFKKLNEMTSEDYLFGLQHKLMGQVNLVLIGKEYLSERGSFTLTSGILNYDPILAGSSAAMVNGALEGFVRAAAIELAHQSRINLISPTVLTESMSKYADYFRGFLPVDAQTVALAYLKSVEGAQTGQIYRVGY